MRQKIVFVLILALFSAMGVMFVLRDTAPVATAGAAADAGADGAVLDTSIPADAGAQDAGDDGGEAGAPPPDPGILGRPLRVVGLGWELVAPGLIANMGATPGKGSEFAAARLPVTIKAVELMSQLESSLARGGTDPEGADIAIMPLPLLVSAYERLRALEPSIFFVVGWSRGREAVLAGEAGLPAFAPTGDVPILIAGGDLPVFLGLFVLDSAGVDPSRVRLLEAESSHSEDVPIAAIDRVLTDEALDKARRKILLTTADAPHLVPFVAVAQRRMIEQNAEALALWARIWLDGYAMLRADVTASARQVAANKGSPEPLSLLTRLGQIELSPLPENAHLLGLSGRGAVTIDALFQRTWLVWRASGALATPAPAAAPISTEVVATLVRNADASLTELPETLETAPATPPSSTKAGPIPALETMAPLFVRREPEGPEGNEDLLRSIGFLAGVFHRSPLRVTAAKNGTAKLIANAAERFDIRPSRLVAGKATLGKEAGAIEVLPAQ